MFGYVTTDLPNLYVKDTVLYKAMYCGLCKSLGKTCGVSGRLLLNYDLAFLSAFIHNIKGEDVKIEKQRCILHHISKRPVALPTVTSEQIAAVNVILAYYKLTDDVLDNGKGKIKRSIFKKAYKKAKKSAPIIDKIVKDNYRDLLKLEKNNSDNVDAVSEPFGNMLREIVKEILKDGFDEAIDKVSFNLGKWIYLIDALDDFDKDKKKKNYNVFANSYSNVKDKKQLIREKREDLEFIFGNILAEIYNNSINVKYKFNHDLIDNVLQRGLMVKTKKIMEQAK